MNSAQLKEASRLLETNGQRVFKEKELTSLLAMVRSELKLGRRPVSSIRDDLEQSAAITRTVLASEKYAPITRFTLPGASVYEIALSLRPASYFSHGSAISLHGLTLQIPRTIYVNKEQSEKPAPTGGLSQEAIDRAFANQQRESTYVYHHSDWRIVLLNGKNTAGLEVGELRTPDGLFVPATKLERTLIDIAVRPNYAGGVYEVLEAYRSAKARVSVNVLVSTLKKMWYVYPYHQIIGFYMQRAGYEESRLALLRELGMTFDFYLTYGIRDREYVPEWRLFIPANF